MSEKEKYKNNCTEFMDLVLSISDKNTSVVIGCSYEPSHRIFREYSIAQSVK